MFAEKNTRKIGKHFKRNPLNLKENQHYISDNKNHLMLIYLSWIVVVRHHGTGNLSSNVLLMVKI